MSRGWQEEFARLAIAFERPLAGQAPCMRARHFIAAAAVVSPPLFAFIHIKPGTADALKWSAVAYLRAVEVRIARKALPRFNPQNDPWAPTIGAEGYEGHRGCLCASDAGSPLPVLPRVGCDLLPQAVARERNPAGNPRLRRYS